MGESQCAFRHPFLLSFPSIHDRYGSFAGEASLSRHFSPLPQPLASPIAPQYPRGHPLRNSLSLATRFADAALLVTQLLAPAPGFAVTVASLGFHSDATKGRGKGPAAWGPILIGVGYAPFFLVFSSLRSAPWMDFASWLAIPRIESG